MDQINLEKVREFLKNRKWTFAKTMKQIPHEWTALEGVEEDREMFVQVACFIHGFGTAEYFWRKKYMYLHMDGYKYWTMDDPLEKTDLINRAKVEE